MGAEPTKQARRAIVAGEQRGRINVEQLLAIGYSYDAIERQRRSGGLHRLHSNVYAVGHPDPPPLGDEVAALLAVGSVAVLSHRTAAAIWGFWPEPPTEVEVLVPAGRARSRPGIVVHRTVRLAPADVRRRHGLPLTTAERVLLDLADHHPADTIRQAYDEARGRHLISRTKVAAILARSPGRSGAALLAHLNDPSRPGGPTRHEAERRMLGIIRQAGLPEPERNVTIGPYNVDCHWPAANLVVEVDSLDWHLSPWAFKRDRRKDAYLIDRGLDVYRVTWEMMDSPLPLVARLARRVSRPDV